VTAPTTEPAPDQGPDPDSGHAHQLTHVDAAGRAAMVDVSGKEVTRRVARAGAVLRVQPSTARLLADGGLPKGDAVAVARIAGIQAAKRTHELIPLCHQLRLTRVDVAITVDADAGTATIVAEAAALDRTGVEMEALTAATVAGLTLYDMVKAVERSAVLTDVRLLAKSGGASGDFIRAQDPVA